MVQAVSTTAALAGALRTGRPAEFRGKAQGYCRCS